LYLDIFAPRLQKEGKARVQKYDIIVAHRLEERLTHKVLWALMERLCNTLHLPVAAESIIRRLRSVKFDGMSSFRNSLIYNGGVWLNSEDGLYASHQMTLSMPASILALQRK
jgi:hypothetical protein